MHLPSLRKRIIFAAVLAATVCGCHRKVAVSLPVEPALARKVGQLMMVGFKGPEVTPEIRKTLRELQPGGICLYKQNITGAREVAKLNDDLRACLDADNPPFLAVDQEGGVVVRIDDEVTAFPGAMALGATGSVALAAQAGAAQGKDLRLLGFNMNLAPVLDVPNNPAIGTRSFGDQPQLISALGTAYVTAQQNQMIATIAKHFPGEGHSRDDSHTGLPVRWEREDVLRKELAPFREVMDRSHLDGLMTAHVAMPAFTNNRLPATISPQLLGGLLRHEFAFDGLILTDELEGMRAISSYGVGHAAVAAIKSGADMVFVAFSADAQKEVQQALVEAVRAGEITAARLDEAVNHIVALKRKRRVFETPPPREQRLAELDQHEDRLVAEEIARKSVTCLRLLPDTLPLRKDARIGIIGDSENFAKAVKVSAPQAELLLVDSRALKSKHDIQQAIDQLAQRSDVIIAGFIYLERLEFVRDVKCPLIAVLMNVPDAELFHRVPNARMLLATYSYQPVSVQAAVAAIFDQAAMPGVLPVQQPLSSATGTLATQNQAGISR